MKRWTARLVLVFLAWWAIPFTPDVFDAQSAGKHRSVTVLASADQTGNGANTVTGTSADITGCVNVLSEVTVSITAGSGTVNPFKVWIQASADGSTWATVACPLTVSSGGTVATNTNLIENETTLQTSGTASGQCTVPLANVRAAWIINGTTPHETFSVVLSCYS